MNRFGAGVAVCIWHPDLLKSGKHIPITPKSLLFESTLSQGQVLWLDLGMGVCNRQKQSFARVHSNFCLPNHRLNNSVFCSQCVYPGNTHCTFRSKHNLTKSHNIGMRYQCWNLTRNYTAWCIRYRTYKATSKRKDQITAQPIDTWKEKCVSEAASL